MVKLKSEAFLSNSRHGAMVISGVFWGLVAVDLIRVYQKMAVELPETKGFLIGAMLFAALSVFLLLRGISKATTEKRSAMKSRENFIQCGVVFHGKIVDASGGYFQKRYYREGHARRQKYRYFFIWESKWWADIEYYDETKGIYAKRRVTDLNKSAKLHHLIGRDVDVYRLEESFYVDFK